MKKIKYLLLSLLMMGLVSGCSLTSQLVKDVVKSDGILKPMQMKPDMNISVKLTPGANPTDFDKDAQVVVTNTKSGKTWNFSHQEFKLIINSWNNWRLVSENNAEISKIEQDNKYIYITFNYYKIENNGKTKTSVLSGIVVINKTLVNERTKTESILIGVAAGFGVSTVVLAVLLAILMCL